MTEDFEKVDLFACTRILCELFLCDWNISSYYFDFMRFPSTDRKLFVISCFDAHNSGIWPNILYSSESLPQYAQAMSGMGGMLILYTGKKCQNIRITGDYSIQTSKVVVTD